MTTIKYVDTSFSATATGLLSTPINLIGVGIGTNQRLGPNIQLLGWGIKCWWKQIQVGTTNCQAIDTSVVLDATGGTAITHNDIFTASQFGFNQDSTRWTVMWRDINYIGSANRTQWGAGATPPTTFGDYIGKEAQVYEVGGDFAENTITTYVGPGTTIADVGTNQLSIFTMNNTACIFEGRARVYFIDV